MKTIEIIERIEGEAKLNLTWNESIVSDARIEFLNFRGFEYILEGKSILDALIYTPRICGICGQAHLLATVKALENLYKNSNVELQISNKAHILRELGVAIEIIDSHIKWFYMFILPDMLKHSQKDLGIYQPLKGERWLEANSVACETLKSLAIIGGQWPHTSYMLPGGVMSDPTLLDIATMENYIDQAGRFFEKRMSGMNLDDFLGLNSIHDMELIGSDMKMFKDLCFESNLHNNARGYDRHIVLGSNLNFQEGRIKNKNTIKVINYEKIEEFSDHTFNMKKEERTSKEYTWAKSVNYHGLFYESGPLSRALISGRKFVKEIHKSYKDSVLTRVFARLDELAYLIDHSKSLIKQIDISEESYIKPKISIKDIDSATARGVIEAARGSLVHEVSVKKGKIEKYNVITPTVWNLGPGRMNTYGVAQKSIIGASSQSEASLILRSFDVCSVCTTH